MQNNATTADDIIREIKHILVEEMQLNVTAAEIPDDYSLLESGLALDSILISELIARIEDRFGLQFDDRLLEAELFDSISRLAAFVGQEQMSSGHGAQGGQKEGAKC
jgi:acyl carrier protein